MIQVVHWALQVGILSLAGFLLHNKRTEILHSLTLSHADIGHLFTNVQYILTLSHADIQHSLTNILYILTLRHADIGHSFTNVLNILTLSHADIRHSFTKILKIANERWMSIRLKIRTLCIYSKLFLDTGTIIIQSNDRNSYILFIKQIKLLLLTVHIPNQLI